MQEIQTPDSGIGEGVNGSGDDRKKENRYNYLLINIQRHLSSMVIMFTIYAYIITILINKKYF